MEQTRTRTVGEEDVRAEGAVGEKPGDGVGRALACPVAAEEMEGARYLAWHENIEPDEMTAS